MKILKKLFGGNTKIHVDEIADSQGRLLSQSVIVESDNNANGRYIKYADGTLECYRTLTNTTGSFGTTWAFPMPFIEIPTLNVNVNIDNSGSANTYAPVLNIYSLSKNVCGIHCFDGKLGTAFTGGYNLHLKAFGRWKV